MGWKISAVADEKRRFIKDRLSGLYSMTELCGHYGINRESGYTLMRGFEARGMACVEPASRAPHEPGNAMEAWVSEALIELRRRRPNWGPRKLKRALEDRHPETTWPARSTIGDLLKREGLVAARRRRHGAIPVTRPFGHVEAANDLWCLDFKGWFRTGDGRRCDPFTASDAASRYLLGCTITEPTIAGVDALADRLFQHYGLPVALRMDNGSPFGSQGAGGLTKLSVKWLKLGLGIEFIEPGHPEQNSQHERMHRTLKEDALQPPAPTPKAQQKRFDDYRRTFNHERPHQALGDRTPASIYVASERPYPSRLREPEYGRDHQVRRVRSNGEIKWRGERLFIGEAFVGEPVGIRPDADGDDVVTFAAWPLGRIEWKSKKFRGGA
jgi:transposase InsO family protein